MKTWGVVIPAVACGSIGRLRGKEQFVAAQIPSQVTAAMAYAQTAASDDYEGTFAAAAQGFWTYSASAYPSWAAVGVTTIGSGQLSGFTDYTQQNGDGSFAPTANVALSGSENSDVGIFTLYGLSAGSFQAQGGYGYYPIDSKPRNRRASRWRAHRSTRRLDVGGSSVQLEELADIPVARASAPPDLVMTNA